MTLPVVVLGTAGLGACGVHGESDPGADSPGAVAATTPAADDAALCTAFGDVLTIVENADLGLAERRMATQEQLGWYRLATRVLDRLPADGDGAVQAAIADLQDAAPVDAPADPSAPATEATGVGSPEWGRAQSELGTACEEIGAPLEISVFTGG